MTIGKELIVGAALVLGGAAQQAGRAVQAQAPGLSVSDWINQPFAIGAAIFLLWTLSQLAYKIYERSHEAQKETIAFHRAEAKAVQEQKAKDDDKLRGLLGDVTTAMLKMSRVGDEQIAAWGQAHADIAALRAVVSNRPCFMHATPEGRQFLKSLSAIDIQDGGVADPVAR